MDEQYYWIELNFPFFGFWGATFKFWSEFKRTTKKLSEKAKFFLFEIVGKAKIREPT